MARFWFGITGVRLKVNSFNHIDSGPCVIVANHASYLDGLILKAVLPPRFGFVIKREVTRVPLIHFLLRRIGSEFVERRNRYRSGQDARRIVELAKSGNSIAVFPEGTFTAQPGLAQFRPGAFAAAVAGELPVVPVVIEGSRAMLSADRFLPRPGAITVTALPPLHVSGEGRDAMKDMAKRSRAAILDVLNEPDLCLPNSSPSELQHQVQRENNSGS
ncbi:MAG: lysophospholipid acyltransferase family protein [Gammaproteobacteria bacterium]